MQEFRLMTGELDEVMREARKARRDFLRSALARLWDKLSGRIAGPVTAIRAG